MKKEQMINNVLMIKKMFPDGWNGKKISDITYANTIRVIHHIPQYDLKNWTVCPDEEGNMLIFSYTTDDIGRIVIKEKTFTYCSCNKKTLEIYKGENKFTLKGVKEMIKKINLSLFG